jgi:hypothetical protein
MRSSKKNRVNVLGSLWLSVPQPLRLYENTTLSASQIFLSFVLSFPSDNFFVSLAIDSFWFFNGLLLMLRPGCGRGEGGQEGA